MVLISRSLAAVGLTIGTLALSTYALTTEAQADWRYGHRYRGGDVALGVIGGLAAGALVGGALAQPRYVAPPPPPVYGYGYRPVGGYYAAPVYEEPVVCQWVNRRQWIDQYTYQVRRVRVCN